MIVIDAFSNWLEVVNMKKDTTSSNLIKKLREIFSRLGLHVVCVSDNGPQLVSNEFESFLKKNGISHITIAYYKAPSNGQAEAMIKKSSMKKMLSSRGL